jgi:hypothetical protein
MVSFSPDERRIAVCAGGGRDAWAGKLIAVIELQNGAISYLTGARMSAVTPAWSSHGTAIAYSAAPSPAANPDPGGGEEARRLLNHRRIWVTDAKSATPPRQLTHNSRYRGEKPVWSANGSHILFCRIIEDTLVDGSGRDQPGSGRRTPLHLPWTLKRGRLVVWILRNLRMARYLRLVSRLVNCRRSVQLQKRRSLPSGRACLTVRRPAG